ncbi:cryptochrome/photolyase family protein [Dietzia sp.]|uniref:cryptochrome/photolyase family protein n=1 Tax=Dietzia sp. TaxID=1871616 RepID=UPI002FD92CA1
MSPSLLWFRRDLRVADHPALAMAAENGPVLAVFVLDPTLVSTSGRPRASALRDALLALDEAIGHRLCVVRGDPATEIPRLAEAIGAGTVVVSADHGPYGTRRDAAVERTLAEAGRGFVRVGSPYAVTPGRVLTANGTPYKVFTPFRRAWYEHGWPAPADTGSESAEWLDPAEIALPEHRPDTDRPLRDLLRSTLGTGDSPLEVCESAASAQWADFLEHGLPGYADDRDRPDLDATSRLGAQLKFGTIHPRTILADLAALGPTTGLGTGLAESRDAFASELAWREFYADVLHHYPSTAGGNVDVRWDRFPWVSGDHADEAFAAWRDGRTGYPIVDAGMRQLLAEGWMHNRLRMVVASFLTKDLRVHWRRGARHFMDHLVDGDLASNQHGWQWTAGTGTDAAPYFRVFNPVTQGKRFDPEGDYVRRWVPELRGIAGAAVHTPREGGHGDYPAPIVDHAEARREALALYDSVIRGA